MHLSISCQHPDPTNVSHRRERIEFRLRVKTRSLNVFPRSIFELCYRSPTSTESEQQPFGRSLSRPGTARISRHARFASRNSFTIFVRRDARKNRGKKERANGLEGLRKKIEATRFYISMRIIDGKLFSTHSQYNIVLHQ